MTLDNVDRALYELIRLKVVELGYLPDLAAMSTVPEYKAARETLKASLPDGKLIDVFGVGSAPAKGAKHVNRFTIHRKSITNSSSSTSGVKTHEPNGVNFDEVQYPDTMSNLTYEVRTITDSVQYERLMSSILRTTLGTMRSINAVDDTGNFTSDLIPIVNTGAVNINGFDSIIEWMYSYSVNNIWIGDYTVLRTNVVPINTIDFQFTIDNNIIKDY